MYLYSPTHNVSRFFVGFSEFLGFFVKKCVIRRREEGDRRQKSEDRRQKTEIRRNSLSQQGDVEHIEKSEKNA